MAEQPLELRRINWTDCCSFTQLFRAFRMAIQPGKLGLALVGVILTFLWGWTLDGLTPATSQVMPGELDAFWHTSDMGAWREAAAIRRTAAITSVHAARPMALPANIDTRLKTDPNAVIDETLKAIADQYAGDLKNQEKNTELKNEEKQEAMLELAANANTRYREIESLRPQGIFTSFVAYETRVLRKAMDAAYSLNVGGGLRDALNARRSFLETTARPLDNYGVLGCAVLALRGKQWLIQQHWMFATLFGLGVLIIWAIVGGAICRMAALNYARDERIGPRAALGFATDKFLSFLTAPLLPLLLILVVMICFLVGGLLMAIPYIGEVIGALTLFLGLIGGFIVALVMIGYTTSAPLFYPTIAVEGSDSFDAISRSFGYVFARPWRALFYALVAFFYGSLCYLFVRLLALLTLKSTHAMLNVALSGTHRPGTGNAAATKLDAMWSSPTFEHLYRWPTPFGAVHFEGFSSVIIAFWVSLVVGLMIAFIVSFHYCSATIIYFLLRREVDATDLEDVYVGDEDEESPLGAPAGAAPAAAGSIGTPMMHTPGLPPGTETPPAVDPPSA